MKIPLVHFMNSLLFHLKSRMQTLHIFVKFENLRIKQNPENVILLANQWFDNDFEIETKYHCTFVSVLSCLQLEHNK